MQRGFLGGQQQQHAAPSQQQRRRNKNKNNNNNQSGPRHGSKATTKSSAAATLQGAADRTAELLKNLPAATDMKLSEACIAVWLASGAEKRAANQEEALLGWAERGFRHVANEPLFMARKVYWDMFSVPASRDEDAAVLEALLRSRCVGDSAARTYDSEEKGAKRARRAARVRLRAVTGTPEAKIFIERLLPGSSDEKRHAKPFVELARRHPAGRSTSRETRGTTAEGFDPEIFEPLTTKAGGQVWSVYFAAVGSAPRVAALRASYPCQLAVRHAPGFLAYEAMECVPLVKGPAYNSRYEAVVKGDVDAAALATTDELAAINLVANSTSLRRGRERGGEMDVLRLPPFATSSAREKIAAYGAEAFRAFLNHVRWRRSLVRRARFNLSNLVGARLVALDADRPNAEFDDEKKVPLGVLALEWRTPFPDGEPSFATTKVADAAPRQVCSDWTPECAASLASRHYVVGDLFEITELAEYLAAVEPRVADLFVRWSAAHHKELPNSLAGAPPSLALALDRVASVEDDDDDDSFEDYVCFERRGAKRVVSRPPAAAWMGYLDDLRLYERADLIERAEKARAVETYLNRKSPKSLSQLQSKHPDCVQPMMSYVNQLATDELRACVPDMERRAVQVRDLIRDELRDELLKQRERDRIRRERELADRKRKADARQKLEAEKRRLQQQQRERAQRTQPSRRRVDDDYDDDDDEMPELIDDDDESDDSYDDSNDPATEDDDDDVPSLMDDDDDSLDDVTDDDGDDPRNHRTHLDAGGFNRSAPGNRNGAGGNRVTGVWDGSRVPDLDDSDEVPSLIDDDDDDSD